MGKYKKVQCSISGGSDSDLILDIMHRLDSDGIVDYVFFDTGLEYTATKEHIEFLERKYGIEVRRIKAQYPVPLAVRLSGQPFLSKQVSEYISRLQNHGFKFEDKPYEELCKEYPNCIAALKWWCNYKGEGVPSMFDIRNNKWLKEFLIENPPYFQISSKCCDLAKKHTAHNIDNEYDLVVIGVRKSEGGARAGHNTCVTFGKTDKYRPIFWFSQSDKEEYEKFAHIEHSKCYTEYGLRRTGCAGCPFGRNFEYELEVLKEHEPLLYKAACNIFADSYAYTRKYREFCKRMDEEKRKEQYGYQISLFDFD